MMVNTTSVANATGYTLAVQPFFWTRPFAFLHGNKGGDADCAAEEDDNHNKEESPTHVSFYTGDTPVQSTTRLLFTTHRS